MGDNSHINTITLSRQVYEQIQRENDRSKLLLDSILKSCTLDDNLNLIVDSYNLDCALSILFPEAYKRRLSALKGQRTKEQLKTM